MTKSPILLAVLVLLVSAPAFAALSPALQEWGKGPAQWLMTKDEQRAWSKLQTDEQANEFIDLFWARRDPTPGTERNEFKQTFDQRVAATDKGFAVGKKRGSLTDQGRIFIVLGPPDESSGVAGGPASTFSAGQPAVSSAPSRSSGPDTSGPASSMAVVSRMSGRNTFMYKNWLPLGLARSEIVFIEDGFTHEYKVDPQQGNPFGALARAAEASVVNKDLTSVPAWAMHGGINQAPTPIKVAVTKVIPGKAVVPDQPAATIQADPGAGRLVLLKDVTVAVKPQSGGDPLAVESQQSFGRSDELGYAFQLCRGAVSDDTVKVTMKVSGLAGTHAVNLSAPAEEMMPERIKASSSCYVVRAAIPLAEFEPGAYRLEILVDDGGKTYNLGQEFKVE